MYMEDTDLSRRIRQRYRTVYYPRAVVIHGYAKASYKTLKLTMHHIKSSIKYFNKWGWFSDTERSVLNSTIKYAVDPILKPPPAGSRTKLCEEAVSLLEQEEERFQQIFP